MDGWMDGHLGAWILKWVQPSSSLTERFTLLSTIQKCLAMSHLSKNSEQTPVVGAKAIACVSERV